MEELLQPIKEYLNITWDDDVTDNNIKGFIARGQARLNKIAGVPLNFEEEGQARALLFDYCRYANSKALEMFEKNFLSELVSLQIESMVNSNDN